MIKLNTKKRHSKSKSIKVKEMNQSLIEMSCSICGSAVTVDANTVSVICSDCVQKSLPVLEVKTQKEKVESGFPRGWRWMKIFVHEDGRVFESGVENKKLKGTLKPTPIKPKLSRKEKEFKKLEKDKKLAKKYAKKQEMKQKKVKKTKK